MKPKHDINRRDFLRTAIAGGSLAVLAACKKKTGLNQTTSDAPQGMASAKKTSGEMTYCVNQQTD